MSANRVSYSADALPPRTEADRARLKSATAAPEGEIDTTDIPLWTAEDFRRAERGKFYRPLKAQITAKVDKDVLAWLKQDGPGYQSRLNAILRREMVSALSGHRGDG